MTAERLTTFRLMPVHKVTQDAFKVYMDGTELTYFPKVGRDTEKPPRVPRDHIGLFSICFESRETDYFVQMELEFEDDLPECCHVVRTGPFSLLLVDNNYRSDTMESQEIKFDIVLVDEKGGRSKADPIVINE